jgi:hypothetical protein
MTTVTLQQVFRGRGKGTRDKGAGTSRFAAVTIERRKEVDEFMS